MKEIPRRLLMIFGNFFFCLLIFYAIAGESVHDWARTIASLGTLIVASITAIKYFEEKAKETLIRSEELKAKEREAIDRALIAYQELGDKYLEFLEITSKYPQLGCFITQDDINLIGDDLARREILYEFLMCTFERGYLLYLHSEGGTNHEVQWQGWRCFILKWLEKPSFARYWNDVNQYFDPRFIREFSR